MSEKKPTLLIMIGAPGSGKSHIAEQFAKKNDYIHINSDSVRAQYFPNPNYSEDERKQVYIKIHELVTDILKRGSNVILDGNLLTNSDRIKALDHYKKLNSNVKFVFLDVPSEIAIRRAVSRRTSGSGMYNTMPLSRAEEMHRVFERPITQLPLVVIKDTDDFDQVNTAILSCLAT